MATHECAGGPCKKGHTFFCYMCYSHATRDGYCRRCHDDDETLREMLHEALRKIGTLVGAPETKKHRFL